MRQVHAKEALEETNNVIVYGTLKRGEGNNDILSGAEFLGEGIVNGYKLIDLGAFPAAIIDDDSGDYQVVGEVFEVPENSIMQSLDMLEGYPDFYDRTIVDTPYGPAWMYYLPYTGRFENYPVIEDGRWLDNNE